MNESPFWYLSDPRPDEEVANDFEIRNNIPGLTIEGREALQQRLRELLIRDRQRLRERVKSLEKNIAERI